MRTTAAILLAASVLSGCYMGRSAADKRTAYVVNGAALVVGAAVALSDRGNDQSCDGCLGAPSAAAVISAPLLVGGLLGLVINAAVPTRDPDPGVLEVGRPTPDRNSESQDTVTAPGLKPAKVTVR